MRARFYDDADAFDAAVESYFVTLGVRLSTLAGLALHLGFCDRDTVAHYGRRPEFSRTVSRARLRIEADRHERLDLIRSEEGPRVVMTMSGNRAIGR